MKDMFLDVRLELDPDELAKQDQPDRFIIDLARDEADKLCEKHGAQLRTDRPPEIIIQEGQHKITRDRMLLVATRWACRTPEDVPTGPPR